MERVFSIDCPACKLDVMTVTSDPIPSIKVHVVRTSPIARFPMGPPWWGAVMGSGIIGTLTQLHVGNTAIGEDLAHFFLIVGWVLMLSFAIAFIIRGMRSPGIWRASMIGVAASAWGMVSMGIVAVGAATATIIPAWNEHSSAQAWQADKIVWTIGTIIGLISTLGFAFGLLKHRPDEPRPAWGLAIVPPMVSCTCGAPFVSQVSSPLGALALLVFLIAFFVCSLTLGLIIFTAAYDHHLRLEPIPIPQSTSSWVPLGVVGQSTAAIQAMATQSERFVTPEAFHGAQVIANIYGFVMLTIAIPLIIFAIVVTLRGAFNRMPFSPGWWALTFPIGTLSLGSFSLAKGSEIGAYSVASHITWAVLLCTWTLCSVASLRHCILSINQFFEHHRIAQ